MCDRLMPGTLVIVQAGTLYDEVGSNNQAWLIDPRVGIIIALCEPIDPDFDLFDRANDRVVFFDGSLRIVNATELSTDLEGWSWFHKHPLEAPRMAQE